MHNLYSISKTLKFELIPQGEIINGVPATQYYFEQETETKLFDMEKSSVLTRDEKRAELFKKVKRYCDEYHKSFISKCLSDLELMNLNKYFEYFNISKRDDKQEKEFNEIKKNLRQQISTCFNKAAGYKGLLGQEIIKDYLPKLYMQDKEALKEIEVFNSFTTYFKGYNENRKNMYSSEEKPTSIAYRLIDENLPVYLKNIKIYNSIKNLIKDDIDTLCNKLNIDNIEKYFTLENYNNTLSQEEIDTYNLIFEGKSIENSPRIKGLNEYLNLYAQKNSQKRIKFTVLKKQILSDRQTFSFKYDVIENDEQVKELINNFYKNLLEKVLVNDELLALFKNFEKYNLNQIFINNDNDLTNISSKIFKDYGYISHCISEHYDAFYLLSTPVKIQLKPTTFEKY